MYNIKPNAVKIDGVKVKTLRGRTCNGNSDLLAEAGTTGFLGCPREKTDVMSLVTVISRSGDCVFHPVVNEESELVGFRILCRGNDALMSLMDVLCFAATEIVNQTLDRSVC